MKTYLFSILILFVSFLFLSSCSEHEKEVSTTAPVISKSNSSDVDTIPTTFGKEKKKWEWPTEIYDSVYGKIIMDTNVVSTRSMTCGIKFTTGWGTHHYAPYNGKFLGVWPWEYTVDNLRTLRTKWGYTGIFAGNGQQYNTARSAGYQRDSIMLSISFPWTTEDYKNLINSYLAGFYYIGEPVDHRCIGNLKRMYQDWELQDVEEYLHLPSTNRPNSVFVSDGYKRCNHFNTMASIVDKVMYSSYVHWYRIDIGGCYTNMGWGYAIEDPWIEGSSDQRSDWSDIRNAHGSKFSMSWIKTSEISEFDELFGHAQNLGLNALWIYGYAEDTTPPVPVPHYNDQWENISQSAWMHLFLRRFVQDYRIEWRCIYYDDPCAECNPDDPNAIWYIYQINPVPGTVREIFY